VPLTLEGKPICVFYDYDVPGIDKGRPFGSPWRAGWIDKVASIPWAGANKNTNIMSDLPSEAALQPNMWGMFVFQKE